MNDGAKYLFETLYRRAANSEDICLADLDYERFVLEDVRTLHDVYNNCIVTNGFEANQVIDSLEKILPTIRNVDFA